MPKNNPVVVVGAGQAAASFVFHHIRLGNTASVILIGDEPLLPYQRPPLSKEYLLGEFAHNRLLIRPQEWYAKQNIAMHLDTRVVSIDLASKQLVTDAGETIQYGQLILCTGSYPRALPAPLVDKLSGVYMLRNLADSKALKHALQPGKKLVVIGGGYIGLEVAAIARELHLEVVVIEAAERILKRVAATETSNFFRALHRDQGVDIRESEELAGFHHDSQKVCGVDLKSGEWLAADLVLVGIGTLPNIELAEQAGLQCENGMVVDAHCRTSDPHVYAAGDCVSFPRNGRQIRLESVQNATAQGSVVARVLAGEDAQYDALPWFWSNQYDCKLQVAGYHLGYTDTIVRPGTSPAGLSVWYYEDAKLLAVDAINEPIVYALGRKILSAGRSPPAEEIANPKVDLKQLAN